MELAGLLAFVVNREPIIDTGTRAQGRGLDISLTDLRLNANYSLY